MIRIGFELFACTIRQVYLPYIGITLLYNTKQMLEFQEKKKIRRIAYSRPILAVLVIFLIIFANAAYGMYNKYMETGENSDIALREKAGMKAKQTELESRLEQLKTDRGVEEEIRKKFRVVKEGEGVIIVVDNKISDKTATTTNGGFVPIFDIIKGWFSQ